MDGVYLCLEGQITYQLKRFDLYNEGWSSLKWSSLTSSFNLDLILIYTLLLKTAFLVLAE